MLETALVLFHSQCLTSNCSGLLCCKRTSSLSVKSLLLEHQKPAGLEPRNQLSGTGNEGHFVAMTAAQGGHVVCNNAMKRNLKISERDHLYNMLGGGGCAKPLKKAIDGLWKRQILHWQSTVEQAFRINQNSQKANLFIYF